MQDSPHLDLARAVLGVLSIAALLLASFWILQPFVGAAIWATTIVVATWPMLLGVQRRLFNSRALAVTVMTLLMLLVLIGPLTLAILAVVDHADEIVEWVKGLRNLQDWRLPGWLAGVPLVGPRLVELWRMATSEGVDKLIGHVTPYAGSFTRWFVAQVGSLGGMLVQFLLTIAIATIFYANGEVFGETMRRFGERLAGKPGEGAVRLAGQAIRGVALGVVVTALAQAVLGGLGLWVAGVPYPGLLTAGMFVLALAQIGAVPVLIGSVIWTFAHGDTGWGVALIVWTVIVGSMDNVLRPILIKKGADLPLLLVFAGVIGGLISFGLLGIFVGPVVLAVAFKLLMAWVGGEPLLDAAAVAPELAARAATPAGIDTAKED